MLSLVVLLAGGLLWLNGPGWRWLAPKVAAHFLEGSGIELEFELEGRLTGGIAVKDVNLESETTLAGLTARRVELDYRFSRLLDGRIYGIIVDGLHAELGLASGEAETEDSEEEADEEKKPLDLKQLVETLRSVREMVIPVALDVTDLSLKVTKDGEDFLNLAETDIKHVAGDLEISLEVGEITDAVGKAWPARESEIMWHEDDITINRLDPVPGVGIEDLVLRLPEGGMPSASAKLHVDEAVFGVDVPEGMGSLSFSLLEGKLQSDRLVEHFGLELPARGSLTSFSLNLENPLPDPLATTGEVRLLLEDVRYDDWEVAQMGLDVSVMSDLVTLTANVVGLGTELNLNAAVVVDRGEEGIALVSADGAFDVPEVSALASRLDEKLDGFELKEDLPRSSLAGGFQVGFDGFAAKTAGASLVLSPEDPELVSALKVSGGWGADGGVKGEVNLDGVEIDGSYDLNAATYQGTMRLDGFTTERVVAWLKPVGAEVPGVVGVSGDWNGRGEVKSGVHRGLLNLGNANWASADAPDVDAAVVIDYDWPEAVRVRNLGVKAANQSVDLNLAMEDGVLKLEELNWMDGERQMMKGRGHLPVPKDLRNLDKWRQLLANDVSEVDFEVESEVIHLADLKELVPALAGKVSETSTGYVKVRLSGTYGTPEFDALLDLRGLGSPSQPDLPPADFNLKMRTGGGVLMVDGKAEIPDYAPAVLNASMGFKPRQWAEDPDSLMDEGFSARVELPKVQVSRFEDLVPTVETMKGVLSGYVEAGGTIGMPEVLGRVELSGGGVVFDSPDFPSVTELVFQIDATRERVTLSNLSAGVAGGSLQGGGALELEEMKPASLDFRLKGSYLPVVRNDSLIVRSNLDLRLAGDWESALLSGDVGVVDSLFYRDIELIPVGKPFTQPSAAALPKVDTAKAEKKAVPEPFGNWRLGVNARTESPFLIRGNFATGRVTANIKVGGTVGKPAPDGLVRIADVRAALPFTTLKVKRGTVKFTPAGGLDPVIEIRGTAEPRPYRVNVFAYGPASSPKLVLTSNPPLPENEIMTLVATGTTTSGLEDPQAASSRGMQLLAEEFRRGRLPLGKQLRPVLGVLDRVDFSVAEEDPYTSEQYSTATFNLSERVFVTAGMGEQGESRVLGFWRFSFK